MMKVNWLKQEAKDGKFKGLEMELASAAFEGPTESIWIDFHLIEWAH
jgi:hypothetical protein